MILKSQEEFNKFLNDYKIFNPIIKLYGFKLRKKEVVKKILKKLKTY